MISEELKDELNIMSESDRLELFSYLATMNNIVGVWLCKADAKEAWEQEAIYHPWNEDVWDVIRQHPMWLNFSNDEVFDAAWGRLVDILHVVAGGGEQ